MSFDRIFPALASTLLSSTLLATPAAASVLLVVPAGAELSAIDRARSAVPSAHAASLVAASDRVRLKGGLEVQVDAPFGKAPPADLVVLLPGDSGPTEEAFLAERRKTARAILLPSGSPLAERLRASDGRSLILLGDPTAIESILQSLGSAPAGQAAEERPVPRPASVAAAPARPASPTPAATPGAKPTPVATADPTGAATPAAGGRVFDRYFSSRPPTPTRTPR